MKNFVRFMMVCMLIVAMTVSMAACGAAEPAATTAATEAPVAAAPTEPEETKAAFVPERYEPTLPPEPTVPETEPTEPATEPVEVEDDYYYEDDSSDNSGSYTPVETTPPATEAPAPVETAPPETEAPVTVSFDYNAAANYGNSYAASTYGWVVYPSAAGYYPACSISVDQAINNGGQAYINSYMAGTVDSTAWNLGGGTFGVWCDCWESDGWIYFVVYYG